jgi:hypothetical protein
MTATLCTLTRLRLQMLSDGVLLLQWTDTLTVTADDVAELIRAREALAPSGCPRMLIELNGMVTLSRQAFVLLAASLDISAAAFIGSSPVEKVLVAHFDAVHHPPYPVGYFENRDKALGWLSQHRAEPEVD